MATKNIVPRADNEGGIGTSIKRWLTGHITTLYSTTFDTNVTAAKVTLSGTTLAAGGTDTNVDINITPKGSGEVNITKVDIDGGTIDNTTIGSTTPAPGAFTTLKQTTGAGDGYIPVSDASGNLTLTASTGTGSPVRATSPTISSPTISGHATIEGVTATGATGTGKFVFDNSPTITSPTVSGNFNLSVTTITSSTTAADYATYIINAQSGNVTLTLPSAATYTSRRYTIMRMDTYQHSSSYKAIIASAAGEKINGVGIVNLANFDSITVQSNGSNWIIK